LDAPIILSTLPELEALLDGADDAVLAHACDAEPVFDDAVAVGAREGLPDDVLEHTRDG
jgi:hypothetical protein